MMPLNILTDPIFPVRLRSQQREYVSFVDLARHDVVQFATHRVDFEGSYAQLAIGLLQLIYPDIQSHTHWGALLLNPPSAEELFTRIQPWISAFEFMGSGTRFMQDPTLSQDDAKESDFSSVSALLIESAGDNTIKENKDLFIKRSPDKRICPCCLAITLFNLQTNAPAGGAGHRTGLRGGGPLVSLLQYQPKNTEHQLWQSLWLNVRIAENWNIDQKPLQPADITILPWLESIDKIQRKDGETQASQVHPIHMLFAMPRRIRLDFEHIHTGHCDLCGEHSEQLVSRYLTKPYGLNYKGLWRHPFSPYYGDQDKPESYLPLHPQPNGFSWRFWADWVFGKEDKKKVIRPADIVYERMMQMPRIRNVDVKDFRLWVFGFDMDNMKARCYYQTFFPLLDLSGLNKIEQTQIQKTVQGMIKSAEVLLSALRLAVKTACFGDADAKGDLSAVDLAFWQKTQSIFFSTINEVVKLKADPEHITELLNTWIQQLQSISKQLYNHDFASDQQMMLADPRRLAHGWRLLNRVQVADDMYSIFGLTKPDHKTKSLKSGAAS